jgi:hypothetical protein
VLLPGQVAQVDGAQFVVEQGRRLLGGIGGLGKHGLGRQEDNEQNGAYQG